MWHWRLFAALALGVTAALSARSALLVHRSQPFGQSTLNVTCSSNDTCSMYNTRSVCVVTNSSGSNKHCACALPVYPYPDQANDLCQQWPGGAGDPCLSFLDCWRDTSLFCNASAGPETGSCACPAGKPNFFGDSCFLDVPDYETGACTSDAQCQAAFGEHTSCGPAVNVSGLVCRCRDGAVFVAGACWLQHGLHEPCAETHECSTAFSVCEGGECRCQAGWREQLEPRTQLTVCVGGAAAAAAGPLFTLVVIVTALRGL